MTEISADKIQIAGGWLARNRDAVSGPLLPFLRRKFDLNILEAIEACKLAHRLEYDERAP
ncbi:hypothetical protein DEM27_01555 [Metarhizobium album]|uniref:Uncharacterized protein n=1 Tax=Metarhizobium album TaxID=2182425 RepID=A0A2U2DX76_9HYPH|nr:hypothetical protein DEM27_01555 [Rhizobium album]